MIFNGPALRDIFVSGINCSYNEGYCLEAKGIIRFNFPENIIAPSINLHIKRISGNGKFTYNGITYSAVSNISETINIPFSKNIEITRNKALGGICILGFSIDPISDKEDVASNWKSLITRCGSYHGIKLIGNKLVVMEGAGFDSADYIESLVTVPDGIYSIDGNSIKFNMSGEIIDLKLSNKLADIPVVKAVAPFPNRDAPSPILPQASTPVPITINAPITEKPTISPQPISTANILFDSKISGLGKQYFLTAHKQFLKIVPGNGQDCLCVKRGGHFQIPLSILLPNKKYIVMISCKKLNGLGRLHVGFSSGKESRYSVVTTDQSFYDKPLFLETLPQLHPDDTPKLNIMMPEDGSGEVLIQRLMVIEDIQTVSHAQILTWAFPGNNGNLKSYSYPGIREATTHSAIAIAEKPDYKLNINCVLQATGYSGRHYIAKVAPYINGLKINDDVKLTINIERTKEQPNILFSKIGELKPASRIYIEEWDSATISNDDKAILRDCDVILSPDRMNAILIQNATGKSVSVMSKPWFIPEMPTNRQNYFLYFERSGNITRALVDLWAEAFPKLCIVGTNVDCPTYIKKISSHLPYSQLIKIINNAAGVISLTNTSYNSSVIDVCKNLGIPIISNNSNNDGEYLNCTTENGRVNISEQKLREILNKQFSYNENTFNMANFESNFKALIGLQ